MKPIAPVILPAAAIVDNDEISLPLMFPFVVDMCPFVDAMFPCEVIGPFVVYRFPNDVIAQFVVVLQFTNIAHCCLQVSTPICAPIEKLVRTLRMVSIYTSP